jgi:hypothetical protein
MTNPGLTLPLLGAASGAIYGATKEGDTRPLFYALIGMGAGVFAGALFGGLESSVSSQHRVGQGGQDVFQAQMLLGQLGYAITPTGSMDDTTRAALKRFQATYSLTKQDGSLDQETLAYLRTVSKQPPPPFTPETGYHPSITQFT